MSDLLLQRSASDLLAMLSAKQLSAEELAAAHIAQIEALDPRLHAFADFDPGRALAQARRLDRIGGPFGPLHGLPLTIKSSLAVAGHRCETGSLLNQGWRPGEDAEAVRRLRAAGAVILGTTNCPEFLMAYETSNRLYGDTLNPWDLTRTAGGSSGGEAAAIAAGLSAGGLGSDGGGSVRIPAHFTGICALKPTPGRVPSRGHLPESTGPFALLGVVGPMARTIEDVDLLFRVLAGSIDTDPCGAPVATRPISAEEARATPIGYFEDDGLIPVTEETRHAVRAAVALLRGAGFRVEPFRSPSLGRACALWYTLFVRCGAMLLEPPTRGREPDLSPVFADFLAMAHTHPPLTGPELLAAWCEVDVVRTLLLDEMRAFPILLSPACAIPAFQPGERSWTLPGDKPLAYLDAMRFAQWCNLLGAPAAVLPILQTGQGLPIGVQVAGRPWADELVLAVGGVLDRGFGYKPPPPL